MKRIFALLLAVLMVFSLAACNNTPDTMFEVDDSNTSNTENNNVSPSFAVDENLIETTVPIEEETQAETNVSTGEKEFALGVIDGNTYKNEFAGITFVADNDWEYYSDEKIRELNSFASDLAGEDYKNAVKNANLLYDMFVAKSDSTQNVNIIFQKCTPAVLENFEAKKFLEGTLSTTKDALTNIGASSVDYEIGKITMGNVEFDCLFLTSVYNNVTLYQAQVVIVRGEYLATISISADSSENLTKIADKFNFE